ncbi:APC family permease [Vibrio sp.]|nr:APC family permease [Vibrio sp.]
MTKSQKNVVGEDSFANHNIETNGVLKKGSLGITHILFFVIAAAAPLTAIVGAAPLSYSLGNGAGTPVGYILAGLVYLIFSIGFTAMSKHVGSAGAFYAFVAKGLGTSWALAAGAITILTYFAIQLAIYAFFGAVISGLLESLSISVPWWIPALVCIAVVDFCGQRQIEFSGKILGVCMLCEIAVLMILNLLILGNGGGPEGISFASFSPDIAFSSGIGISILFAVASFLGFEATVIFSEEAKNPQKTIPRATYLAVIIITLFYAFSAWCMVVAYGPSNIKEVATNDTADLFANTAQALGGTFLKDALNTLLVTSLFACVLSFHNTISRYLFAGGREKVLPSALAKTHPNFSSPYIACRWQGVIAAVLLMIFVVFNADPYTIVYSWMAALSAIGVLSVQILVAISIIRFFAKDAKDTNILQRLISPVLSILGLAGFLLIALNNLPMLTGTESPLIWGIPGLVIVVGILSFSGANLLKSKNPQHYNSLGGSFMDTALAEGQD